LWEHLDTLALAQFRTADPDAAVESQRKALELLPPTEEHFQAQMRQRLEEYEQASGLSGQKP
jgi:hypothetical protein